jgi:iron-sulfur cluster assembly accessory protein
MFNIFIAKDAETFINSKYNNNVLKLSIKSSGCSGYKYDFSIQPNIQPTHYFKKIPFYIEEKDYKFLNNLLINLKIEGLNKKIIFDNPNSKNECGCGESFGLKEKL